ncbi:putative cytochrome P450 [Talaromyces proteolyticus]|uniref:Cytochrome P450 n=1 Tax=Talaromyces proteolyticus TaxID=1131652 RepID=A0AAD4L0W4_9EURO|nr:putative cytochrome P450 [Talaromyces proteolyticus]KAH8705044.1 putative cytochrome P450 [Talaromyces proteolyticus]
MASWSLIGIIVAVLVIKFKPEYSVHESYFLTVPAAILISWILRFIYSAILYPVYFTPVKHIPTPPNRSWLRGNTGVLTLKFPTDLATKWIKNVPNSGLIRYYAIGNLERVLVVSPKAISDLLVAKSYDFIRPDIAHIQLSTITGEGLLVAEGDVHKTQRKTLMPSFSYRHIKDLYPIFWSKAIQMVNEIEKGLPKNGNTIQVSTWSSRAMLDIIGLAGMSYDFNSVKDPTNELSGHYSNLLSTPSGYQRIVATFCLFVIGFKYYTSIPTPYIRGMLHSVQCIRDTAKQILLEKQAKLKRGEDIGIDILSVAMRSGNFSDENLIDQMMTFLAAGHETTSTAFQFAVYAMSKHQHIQTRLREELREKLPLSLLVESKDDEGYKTEPIPASAIDNNFPYLNAFLNEVLRYYPSVPFTSREAAHDTTLAGQHVPKGTNILISPEIINKDEDLWGADAKVFNPDRWLADAGTNNNGGNKSNGGAISNYAFGTFIHGPRSCIGQGFARAELAIFVAVFVSKFEVALKDPEKKLEVRQIITQAPADGVVVNLKVLS